MMIQVPPLLLASASPRRRQIMRSLGLDFTTCVVPDDEEVAQERYQGPIDGLAQWLAVHKAGIARTLPEAVGRIVITADTTVLLAGNVLGKPRDAEHARQLLLSLRGRWHHVVTGLAVSYVEGPTSTIRSASCVTPVLMRRYSEKEVAAYIASGDPMDKAGAYGIQHPDFQPTARIDGCYLNVVGLPLCVLVDLLAEFQVYPRISLRDGQDTACPWSEQCQI
jgi:septum formation protein